uniref:Uncharacterized protein n=1 Tax=Anguilla anguilla TaxID=7936 RepID=A0A0E9V1F2_ANGAN
MKNPFKDLFLSKMKLNAYLQAFDSCPHKWFLLKYQFSTFKNIKKLFMSTWPISL